MCEESLSTLPFELLQEITKALWAVPNQSGYSFRLTCKALRQAYDTTVPFTSVHLTWDEASVDYDDEEEEYLPGSALVFERNVASMTNRKIRLNKNIDELFVSNMEKGRGWELSPFERMCNDDVVQKQITKVSMTCESDDCDDLWRALAIVGNNLRGLCELSVNDGNYTMSCPSPSTIPILNKEQMTYTRRQIKMGQLLSPLGDSILHFYRRFIVYFKNWRSRCANKGQLLIPL